MNTLGQKLKHELDELIPVTLFFFGAFQLLALTEALLLESRGIAVSDFLTATLAALVVAKVVVITDHFAVVNRFPNRPLICNVLWKTLIYFAGWLALRYLEHLIHFWRQTGNFAEANGRLFSDVAWSRFWIVQIWMLVLLLVFCASRELVRVMGRERLTSIFFKPTSPP